MTYFTGYCKRTLLFLQELVILLATNGIIWAVPSLQSAVPPEVPSLLMRSNMWDFFGSHTMALHTKIESGLSRISSSRGALYTLEVNNGDHYSSYIQTESHIFHISLKQLLVSYYKYGNFIHTTQLEIWSHRKRNSVQQLNRFTWDCTGSES